MSIDDASQWIGTPLRGTGLRAPASPMLRRSFTADSRPTRATLSITALGLYEAYLNGQRIGDLELQPGWTEYHHRLYFQNYDVTPYVESGENVIGAFLGDGWFSGKVGADHREVNYGQQPVLRCTLTLIGEDQMQTLIHSDGQWSWTDGPILSSDLMDGEHFDARREIAGWSEPGEIDAELWRPVQIVQPSVEPMLIESFAEPVRVTQEIEPVAEPVLRSGFMGSRYLYDFGQNLTGKVRLKVTGPADATLQLRYAEVLTPGEDALDRSNLRSCEATDSYTFRGDPEGEIWTPRFTMHGFRYAEVSVSQKWLEPKQGPAIKPLDRASLTALVMHNDMPRIGSFTTGHELVNQLQSNITWGLRSNFLEVPTDCPQRDERLGWTGDAQVFAATASFNYRTTDFFKKWLADMRDSQTADGKIPNVVPNVLGDNDSGAGWSDAVVIVPWQVYRASGDRSILENHFEAIAKWARYQADTAVDGVRGDPDHGIFAGFGDWLALDGDSINASDTATPKPLIGTAYHAYSQKLVARIADLLGRSEEAKQARDAAEVATQAFRQHFIDGEKLTVQSQTSHLMALAFDLLPEPMRPGIFDDLLKLLDERDGHLCTGFLGTPLWCDTLSRFGRTDLAYDLLLKETYPGWLFPVTLGATTMWERWNSWHPEQGFVETGMNSLNHYAYGAVGDWMYRHIAGIDLDLAEDVGPRLRLQPTADARLGKCEASLDSAVGRIESSWEIADGKAHFRVVVPEGVPAERVLSDGQTQPLEPGEHKWTATLDD
jgi:alpha-L-rhamnosidase